MNYKSRILSILLKDKFSNNIEDLEAELSNISKLNWSKYPMVDAHIHLVDFNQETLWIKPLLEYMNRTNVEASVIFWLSVVKMWWENERDKPNYYLDDDNRCYYYSQTDAIVATEYLSLSKEDQKRFYPLMCGFNPMDLNSVDHIITTYKTFPWVFNWVGEVFYRHDDLTHLTYWEAPRMNTKATHRLFEFLSEYDLPIVIHNNITAPGVSDYPRFLYELEEVLREFPKVRVVLSHCWASRRLNTPYYAKMVDRLLTEYQNLYVDFSWVVFDEIISYDEKSIKSWIELTEKFSHKIMIWSDVLGKWFSDMWHTNARFDIFLDMLSEDARENITRKVAHNFFKKSKNRVEKNKKRKFYSLQQIKKDD